MENTVITQPQGSNKKKLVIGGVIAVAVIGVGVYMFMGNSKTMYKGALTPGAQVDLGGLQGRNVADQAALPDLPAAEPVVVQPVLNPDAVNNVIPGNRDVLPIDADAVSPNAGAGAVSAGQSLGGASLAGNLGGLSAGNSDQNAVANQAGPAAIGNANQVPVANIGLLNGDAQAAPVVVKNLDGGLAATPDALAGPQGGVQKLVDIKQISIPGTKDVEADAPEALAAPKQLSIDAAALKDAPIIANPNLKQNQPAPAVAVAQPVVDNFGNANSYPEQPETLKRIKELEDALAAQDRARAAASAYGDNNNQMTPEQAAAQANRLAQEAAEARVAQADAMRNAADQPIKKPLQGGVIDVDAIAQAEAANAALEASNSAGAATVTRTARVNAAGRTDATAAGRLHGAAIQGTSGPEVLLYPALIAAANGAYFSLRRRNKNK